MLYSSIKHCISIIVHEENQRKYEKKYKKGFEKLVWANEERVTVTSRTYANVVLFCSMQM